MRLLALSDIHGNVRAVREVRSREANDFDAVIVAGDVGSKAASEIFAILNSFSCPILYVYGNWDYALEYDRCFGPDCMHLHLRSFRFGGVAFAGFSGVAVHWGKNPIAETVRNQVAENHRAVVDLYSDCEANVARAEGEMESDHKNRVAKVISQTKDRRRAEFRAKIADLERKRDARMRRCYWELERLSNSKEYEAYADELCSAEQEIARRNRTAMIETIQESDAGPKRTIVVTHERLTRTAVDLPEIPMFLFGHRHGFRDARFAGARFVNVSVLDKPITVLPRKRPKRSNAECYRNLNDGNYVIVEGNSLKEMRVRCVRLDPDLRNWEVQPFVIIGNQWADISVSVR